ncbi:MAG: P-II family nitrogen regulator [Christensenellaceae bacterium]|jgi:nitrogen regulatory protein PII|nr:P-II family nitrogen regulator [Christensenellaceae bacterium]
MENTENIKALYIIVNAGFSDEAVEITRNCGARGATLINARGTGQQLKTILGIAYEPEKEIIISLVPEHIADRIITAIKENIGVNTPSQGICYTMPVDKMTLISKPRD